MKRSNGFTLSELLVVLAILGILATTAIPGFSRWLPSYRLKGAARDLFSNFQLAKLTAIKDRSECAVYFDSGNCCYQIWSGGPNRIYDGRTGDDVLVKTIEVSTYGSGVNYGLGDSSAITGVVNLLDNSVVFNSRGFINSSGGYVYFQNNRNASYAAGVSASGAVLLRRWTGSTTQWK